MSGLIAEAAAYGKALGATEDLKLLNAILLRCSPPIPARKQQDTTRYAALMAWTILQKHEAAYTVLCDALEQGEAPANALSSRRRPRRTRPSPLARRTRRGPQQWPRRRRRRRRRASARKWRRVGPGSEWTNHGRNGMTNMMLI